MFDRVHIVGSAGSGKSTLAAAVSATHGLPHHELDGIYYENAQHRVRREGRARRDRLRRISQESQWVIEGIFWQPWMHPAFDRAQCIVVLDLPEWLLHWRVTRRHLTMLTRAPLRDYPTFLPTLTELLRLNRRYRQGPLRETLEVLHTYRDKVEVCSSDRRAREVLCLER